METGVLIYSSAEARTKYGRVVELVDSLDSGSSVHCGRAGSSPASPTKKTKGILVDVLCFFDMDEWWDLNHFRCNSPVDCCRWRLDGVESQQKKRTLFMSVLFLY